MTRQYNQYIQFNILLSFRFLFYLTIFIIFIQGPTIVNAQVNRYESVIGLNNNNVRVSSTSSTVSNNDDASYDAPEIYDDSEDFEDGSSSSSSSSTTTTIRFIPQVKANPNISSNIPAQPEEAHKSDYEEESESYQNDENLDDETTNQDNSHPFGDKMSINRPDTNPSNIDSNTKQSSQFTSTLRLPFVPSNFWRDLFSKPGILVGIIGGVVIGMLSAILLVMFIIYRMRKKDEGSYALEEGPRKSPSHAYTRVSSREFFA